MTRFRSSFGWTAFHAQQPVPFGATLKDGATTFRVWAPFVAEVGVKLNGGDPVALKPEPGHPDDDAVWVGTVAGAKVGDAYRYAITANGQTKEFVDPCSRQLTSAGSDASSVIVDKSATLPDFTPPPLNQMVIYELHVGTFNIAAGKQIGTFRDVIDKLDYLKDLGVSAIELMPVHQNAVFDGSTSKKHTPKEYDWGYDVVHFHGLNRSYGNPDDLRALVKASHDRGMAVLLDVVYNHMLDDNRLIRFGGVFGPTFPKGIYFYGDQRGNTPFGPRPDFGRPQVRAHLEENALMWLQEYGIDGLRWDSTSNIRSTQQGANPEGANLLRKSNDNMRKIDAKRRTTSIAEDLQSYAEVTDTTMNAAGLGFDSQWDDGLWGAVRRAVMAVRDEDRDVGAVLDQVGPTSNPPSPFGRVLYSENHDKVGHAGDMTDDQPQIRLPALIDTNDNESVFAKRRSTLAAAIVLTSRGVPMLFQGQEMLETKAFDFYTATPVDWSRTTRLPGIVRMYRDLIGLRRNVGGKTGGLSGPNINPYRRDVQGRTIAYHRYGNGGAGDDVVAVANFSNRDIQPLTIGVPRSGRWRVRFNSGANVYDSGFQGGNSFDTDARADPLDGLQFRADVGIGPYSVVILSQD
jgi:1,4-alpha-glucan branching enzyme